MANAVIGPGVRRGALIQTYERRRGDPPSRPLRVYTADPSQRVADGAVALLAAPYEPLTMCDDPPGFHGFHLEVEAADCGQLLATAALNDPQVLITDGYAPSVSDPRFHQQMVYAVASNVYARFRRALGREIAWGFDRPRLRLRPHALCDELNAAYDRNLGEIRFGYFTSGPEAAGMNFPGGRVFTCLSHDTIVHEVTHALIDGLRSRFTIPTGPDVLGFHEGLADLVAVLMRFSYPSVVAAQIRRVGAHLEQSELLKAVAASLGMSDAGGAGRRSPISPDARYRPGLEAHEIGTVLVTAMFDAVLKIYRRKTESVMRFARPGRGDIVPAELVDILSERASQVASDFLDLAIRALDYCPPVDMTLGEYLRALLTADANLVPDDPWGYRETLIQSFASRGIYPAGVLYMSEDALLWKPPSYRLPPIPRLSFAELRFAGDPSVPASADELESQAVALWEYVTAPQHREEFGLAASSGSGAEDGTDPPVVESIRTSRRAGPDGQVVFDLIAEVTQRRFFRAADGSAGKFFGGSTIVIGPRGEIRFVISKSVRNEARMGRQAEYQKSSGYWDKKDGQYRLAGDAVQLAHGRGSREG